MTNEIAKTNEIKSALYSLKKTHTNKQEWLWWWAKLQKVAQSLNAESDEDISDMVTAENFASAGFSTTEADALMFVMTQDCMGQACTSISMIDRWFSYEM